MHHFKRNATDKTSALQALIRLDCRGVATGSSPELLGYEETTCDAESRDGEKTGIIIHGLLGSARNWRGFSRELANAFAKETGRFSPHPVPASFLGCERSFKALL